MKFTTFTFALISDQVASRDGADLVPDALSALADVSVALLAMRFKPC
jgi:hypothetical protein